jgi:hypothetical protein
MVPIQPIQVPDPLSWHHSTVMDFALNELVNGSQLAPNVEGQPPAWIVPPAVDREPNPSFDYVVSFIRHHERGFTTDYATTTGWSCTTSPQCDFAGGHLRRRLRGVPRDPSELGSLGPPLPHGAAHAHYTRNTGAPRGARRQPVDLAAGFA